MLADESYSLLERGFDVGLRLPFELIDVDGFGLVTAELTSLLIDLLLKRPLLVHVRRQIPLLTAEKINHSLAVIATLLHCTDRFNH